VEPFQKKKINCIIKEVKITVNRYNKGGFAAIHNIKRGVLASVPPL